MRQIGVRELVDEWGISLALAEGAPVELDIWLDVLRMTGGPAFNEVCVQDPESDGIASANVGGGFRRGIYV